MKTLRQTAGWLRSHPWIATSFCAGVIAGLLLCLPLLPYEMPDSSASVIGAALGAVFAVWGAAWVADLKESKHRSYLVRAIESTVEPALMYVEQFGVGLEQIIKKGSGVTREERAARIQSSLTESGPVTERLSEMESRLEFLIPLFLELGGHGAIAYGQLRNTGPALRQCLQLLSWGAYYDDDQLLRDDAAMFERDTRRTICAARNAIALLHRFTGTEPAGGPVGHGPH